MLKQYQTIRNPPGGVEGLGAGVCGERGCNIGSSEGGRMVTEALMSLGERVKEKESGAGEVRMMEGMGLAEGGLGLDLLRNV